MDKYYTPNNIYTIDLQNNLKRKLTSEELSMFKEAKRIINNYVQNNQLTMTYRGDQQSRLRNRLNENNSIRMFEKVFHIGEKGRHYYMDDGLDVNGHMNRDYIRDINDISENTFTYLFNTIKNMLNENYIYEEGFREYFDEESNLKEFLTNIKHSHTYTKVMIRDYYYAYLHTLGRRGVGNFSHFVSTSRNWKEAWKFSGIRDNNKMLVHYLLPIPHHNYAIDSKFEKKLRRICKRKDLPVYSALYENQDEISIKGGLFPHYIFGIHYLEQNKKYFIVNPYLFKMNDEFEKFPEVGFPINQSYFEDLIKTTRYNRYGMVYEGGIFEQMNL